jgi:alkylhydroperoxidase/carboxymuconolactone decarboxylase family protein YurZ
MKRCLSYSGDIIISIPDNMIDEVLKDFRSCINNEATKEDLFKYIAHNIIYCGANNFIEGIGDAGTDFDIIDFEAPNIDIES